MKLEDALNNILDQVKRELNNEPAGTNELTGATYYRLDSKGEEYNRYALLLSGFAVYASYTGVISFTSPYSYEDVKMDISSSTFIRKQELLQLWIDIEKECESTIDSPAYIISVIINQNLGSFRSLENDAIIEKWCIRHLFFSVGTMERYKHEYEMRSYLNIMNTVCSDALGLPDSLNEKDNSVLVTVTDIEFIQNIFLEHKSAKITFYGCKEGELDIRTNILLLPSFNHYQWVDYPLYYKPEIEGEIWKPKGRDMVFCFDVPECFDAIVSASQCYEELKFDDLMYYLKPNGNVIAFGISAKKSDLSKDFFDYHVPFVLSHYIREEQLAIICIKEKDVTQRVYVADVEYNDVYGASLSAKTTADIICRGGFDTYVQPLNKSDFRYCDSDIITYYAIRRDEDKMNYVWKSKKEILVPFYCDECVHEDIDAERILSRNALFHSSKFCYEVESAHYVEMPSCGYLGANKYVSEFGIDLRNIHNISIPHKYFEQMRPILGFDGEREKNEDDKQFEAKLCCRYLTRPIWLTNEKQSIIVHVSASPERPICYKDYHFWSDEYREWGVAKEIIPVNIPEEYDANFIAFIISSSKGEALLIPPSRIEQHLIFERAWNEYLTNLQSELVKTVQVATEQRLSLEFLVEKQYSRELLAARLVPDAERKIKEFLVADMRCNLGSTQDKFTPLRKIVDYIFDCCKNRNLLPPTTINGCKNLLCKGKDKSDYKMVGDGLCLMPKSLSSSLAFFIDITQDASHQKESSETLLLDVDNYVRTTRNLGIFRASLNIVMNILLWWKDIDNKYPNQIAPGILWEDTCKYESKGLIVRVDKVAKPGKTFTNYYAGKYQLIVPKDVPNYLEDGSIVNIIRSEPVEIRMPYWPEGIECLVQVKDYKKIDAIE